MPSNNLGAADVTSSGPVASNNTPNCFGLHEAIVRCGLEYEDILKAMDLNFDIQKIPSMSGVDTIKVQEGNHSMES